jgi:hypothetical protein
MSSRPIRWLRYSAKRAVRDLGSSKTSVGKRDHSYKPLVAIYDP